MIVMLLTMIPMTLEQSFLGFFRKHNLLLNMLIRKVVVHHF